MVKKTLIFFGILAIYSLNAQDVSTVKNTLDVYSNGSLPGSSKYQGMAGSMGALGGDYSTLMSNPAGIGVSIANDVSATLSINSNKNSTSYASSIKNYTINNTDIGNSGGVIVFRINGNSDWKFVNIGINYSTQSIENYTEASGNSNLVYHIDSNNDDLTFNGHAYDRYGHISKMSIGLGTNYDNKLYLGLGLNFHNSNIDQYDTAEFSSALNNSYDYYYKQYTPFSETSDGFSASVGVIGKVNKFFRLGAAIETPTWWSLSRIYNFYNDPYYGDDTGTEDRKLATPMKATLSAALVPSKNFSMNIDYTLGITKPKYKVYGDAETELNDFFKENYKNLSEVKIGAEYRIADFRLRAGYGYASSPFDKMTISTFSDLGTTGTTTYDNLFLGKKNTLALGLGYDFKFFYVDAAFQNIKSEYSNPFLKGSEADNSGYFSNNYIVNSDYSAVSKVKNTINNFFITVGWKF